jgi:glycosyltransferase involved in cell wall biosynthesis
MMSIYVLVTIPVRNEEPRLATAVKTTVEYLTGMNYDWSLVIAEDGSTDNSYAVACKLKEEYPRLLVVHHPLKLGRGKAIRNVWRQMVADVYVFLDADLATEMRFLKLLIEEVIEKGADLATGSRYLRGAVVTRPLLRKMVSLAYNLAVRRIFGTGISDHQCGFKAFSRRAVQNVLPLTREDGWAWDTELIVYSRKMGYRISEIPVYWNEKKTRRTPLRRLLKDIFEHGLALIRIYARQAKLRPDRHV